MTTAPKAPDLDGYLLKLKRKLSLFGSWNRRYFKVNAATRMLEYYQTKDAPRYSKAIHLDAIQSVSKFDELMFQINAGGSGTFMLKAVSMAEYTCWLNGLQIYVDERKQYEKGKYSSH